MSRWAYLAVAFLTAGALLALWLGGLALLGLAVAGYLVDVARRAF